MYTAAEALMRSDCGKVKHRSWTTHYIFNEELKVWEQLDLGACSESFSFFTFPNFLPVIAEKTELEKAKEKYMGKWVKVPEAENLAFKVLGLYKVNNHINVIRSEHQSYHIDQIELLEIEK